jgi:hypothetical protein
VSPAKISMRESLRKHLTIPAKPGAPAPEGIKTLMVVFAVISAAKLTQAS